MNLSFVVSFSCLLAETYSKLPIKGSTYILVNITLLDKYQVCGYVAINTGTEVDAYRPISLFTTLTDSPGVSKNEDRLSSNNCEGQ